MNGTMRNFLLAAITAILLIACSSMKIANPDPVTGKLPTSTIATVTVNRPSDLDSKRGLLILPHMDVYAAPIVIKQEFIKGQLEKLNYFGEVISNEELAQRIFKAGLADKVPSVDGLIGLHSAAINYSSLLYIRFETEIRDRELVAKLILSDPINMENILVAETNLDFEWSGVNDQNN